MYALLRTTIFVLLLLPTSKMLTNETISVNLGSNRICLTCIHGLVLNVRYGHLHLGVKAFRKVMKLVRVPKFLSQPNVCPQLLIIPILLTCCNSFSIDGFKKPSQALSTLLVVHSPEAALSSAFYALQDKPFSVGYWDGSIAILSIPYINTAFLSLLQ